MWKEAGERARVEEAGKGWWGPIPPSALPPLNLFLPVFTAAFGLFTAWQCVLKMVYLTKTRRPGLGLGVKTKSRGLPQECIPLPQGMTSQSK